MDITQFLQEFQLEAGEHLDLLGSSLLKLEREGVDAAVLRQMFLSAHTIKGGASMLSLGVIKALTHALEDVLGALRDGVEPLEPYTTALLFETLDALQGLVEGELQLKNPTPELEDLLERLAAWPREKPGPREVKSTQSPSQPLESSAVLLLEPSNTARWTLKNQLERQGFEVLECDTLTEALEQLEHTIFARVLCPSEPGGIGPQNLLERYPNLKNLWVTALEPIEIPPNAQLLIKGSWHEDLALERT